MRKLLLKLKNHIINYPTPGNLNTSWNFGFLSGACLAIQIISGIFLTMHYTPHTDLAFDSVEHIMRDVEHGWYLRYMHSNGASLFFMCLYVHIGRGLYFKSYDFPRYNVWATGIIIFLLTMATAFVGYVLPWGQMSFWGATVITNLFSAIPLIGQKLVTWLWGGFSINNATLNRFFAIHFFLPFVILGLVLLHLVLIHEVGSSNPATNDNHIDNLKFYPYFFLKDLTSLLVLLFILTFLIHFKPNYLGHPDNYIKANPLVTPLHIVPEWYFLPFYAILRSVPMKLGGVILMVFAILVLFIIPFLSTSTFAIPVRMRTAFRFFFWTFVANFLLLGWIGGQPVEEPFIELGQFCTIFYFMYFLLIIPILEVFEDRSLKNHIKKLQKLKDEDNLKNSSSIEHPNK
jgi:quinol-cytochrome oxidoreductase complex cytochrome b subunit